jgi:hypothetical protein
MVAIEFNTWNTIIKMLMDRLPLILPQYNVNVSRPIDILPAYPRDLTKANKPSIIVRKAGTSSDKLSMDNFIGQYFDSDTNTLSDVKGVSYDITSQIDVFSDSNIQSSLLMSIITEEIFNQILLSDDSRGKFPLYDFTADYNNPTVMGTVTMLGMSDITGMLASNRNNDYITIIRNRFNVVQTVVPSQELIDLSKWIKQKQTINIKGGV